MVDTWGCGVQILRQWGELSPDLVDMQKYAAWKATDIRKALREGRTPTAGPAADSADAKAEADLQAEADLLDDLGLPAVPGRPFNLQRGRGHSSPGTDLEQRAVDGVPCSSTITIN